METRVLGLDFFVLFWVHGVARGSSIWDICMSSSVMLRNQKESEI